MLPSGELPRSSVSLDKLIGSGAFGEVFRGTYTDARGTVTPVAVKRQKVVANRPAHLKCLEDDFVTEGQIQAGLDHPNVCKQIGKVFKSKPLLIVLELIDVSRGPSGEQSAGPDLPDFLMHREHKPTEDQEMVAMLKLSEMACRGVDYIHRKGVVHCDLAARNVLVDARGVLKVADFGLARRAGSAECDVSRRVFPISVRWSAPEVATKRIMSTRTDVWSLGILLYELHTGGSTPYMHLKHNKDVAKAVADGYRMPMPAHCAPGVYAMMRECWDSNPAARPTAGDLLRRIPSVIVATMTSATGRRSSELAPHRHHYETAVKPLIRKRSDEEKRASVERRGTSCADTFNWFHGVLSKKHVRGHVEPLLHEQGDFCVHRTHHSGEFVISGFTDHPVSMPMRRTRGRGFAVAPPVYHATICDLVRHHMATGDPVRFVDHAGVDHELLIRFPVDKDESELMHRFDCEMAVARMAASWKQAVYNTAAGQQRGGAAGGEGKSRAAAAAAKGPAVVVRKRRVTPTPRPESQKQQPSVSGSRQQQRHGTRAAKPVSSEPGHSSSGVGGWRHRRITCQTHV